MENFDDKRLKGEVMPTLDISVQDYKNGDIYFMSSEERSRAEAELEIQEGYGGHPHTPGPLNNKTFNFIGSLFNLVVCLVFYFSLFFRNNAFPPFFLIVEFIITIRCCLLVKKEWDYDYFYTTCLLIASGFAKLFFLHVYYL